MAGLAAATSTSAQADDDVPPGSALTLTTVDLPPTPDGLEIVGLALDRAWAYAGLRAGAAGAKTLYRTASDGTGTWEAVIDPVTNAPLVYVGSRIPDIDNGVIAAALSGSPCITRIITGPGAASTVPGCDNWRVTHGGAALTNRTSQQPYPWVLYDLGGNVLDSGDAGHHETVDAPPVVDGVLAEFVPGNRIATRGVGSTTWLTSQQLPASCDAWPFHGMRDGNIVAGCIGQDYSVLLRQDGSLRPHQLPGSEWEVGNGFGVRRTTPVRGGPSYLEIMDLGAGHDAVEVPTVAYPGPVPDRGDARSVLHRSSAHGLRVLTVAGLQPPLTTTADDVAPTIAVDGPGLAFAYEGSGPHFSWHGADPGNDDTLDYQSDWKAWVRGTPEPAWANRPVSRSTSTGLDPDPGVGGVNLCLRARAIDWAGNVGEWSTRCTYLDATDPVVEWRPSDDRNHDTLVRGTSGVPIRLSWAGGDDDQVRYGVRYWVAPPGRPRGALVRPAVWTDTTATSLSKAFAAGSTVCFWVRAADRAGRQGSPDRDRPRCKTVPMDDRSFEVRGGARRVRLSGAYSGTATVLRGPRDAVVRSGMRVNTLHVRVVGVRPRSCPRARIGTLAAENCVTFTDGRSTTYRYRFRNDAYGSLQIALAESTRLGVRIDAMWAIHY